MNLHRAGALLILGAIHLLRSHQGGGRGVKEVANFATVLIGCVKLRTRGGGGPKSRKFCERNKWMLSKPAI